jgi:hypothetical protein
MISKVVLISLLYLATGITGTKHKFPAFDDLPKVEGMPQGSIWGFYDKDGKKDEIGCLSHSSAAPPNLTNTLQPSTCSPQL